MCGIAGILHLDGRITDDALALHAMCESLIHRGPDGQGFLVDGPVRLTMRRLSIIDVDGGDQPISNESGTIHVILNGEIYNYVELRNTLECCGHRFRTRSDTETIVHAYEQWGDDFVDRLNGMFAIAVWDSKRERLVLARDRAGIKPLYYAHINGTLVFASEIKALLQSGYVSRELDLNAFSDYLSLEYVPSPNSIFKGVHRLSPGCLMVASPSGVQTYQYWDLELAPSEMNPAPGTDAEHAETFLHVLRGAVEREMVSDVPVGVLLSGGIDSSTVAYLMSEIAEDPIPTFSVSFAERSFDESAYARSIATTIGAEHHELPMGPNDLLGALPTIIAAVDEPFADPSIIPTFLVSRFAREHVKVVLGGDGGDEMLAGYSTLQAHRLSPLYRSLPAMLRRWGEWAVSRMPVSNQYLSLDFLLSRFIQGSDSPPYVQHQVWTGALYGDAKMAVMHPDVRSELDHDRLELMLAAIADSSGVQHPLNRILYQDFKLYLEGDILTKVDRASMANALETRVPMLNLEVMEYLQHIPLRLKLRGMTRKYLLRRAMEEFLPPDIIRRRKRGFSIPVAAWINGDLRDLVHEYLDPVRLEREAIFDGAEVARLLDEHARGVRNHAKRLWTILMFQQWRECWLDSA